MKITMWCDTPWCPHKVEVDMDTHVAGQKHFCHECQRQNPPPPPAPDEGGYID